MVKWLLNALALVIVASLIPGFHLDSFWAALIAAAILGVSNILIRPILLILTLPINIISLGFFTFVVNALMLELTSSVVKGFTIDSFGAALIGAILLWAISLFLDGLNDPDNFGLELKKGRKRRAQRVTYVDEEKEDGR